MRFANPTHPDLQQQQQQHHQLQHQQRYAGVGQMQRNLAMKMTMSTGSTMTPRIHRKALRTPSKLHPGKLHPGKLHTGKRQASKGLPNKLSLHQHQMQHAGKMLASRGKMLTRTPSIPRPIEMCDNSNDSGLGFDHPLEVHIAHRNNAMRFTEQSETAWDGDGIQAKIPKLDLKFDSDNANDNFNFPETTMTPKQPSPSHLTYRNSLGGGKMNSPLTSRRKNNQSQNHSQPTGPVNLCSQLLSYTRDSRVQLQIISQPEQQHRARYQTEGSRGAVKDRSGNSFPIVKLVGYDKPATLQVFIGTDIGRVAPHMFYQACRVFGKNSTPCSEKKEDGTVLIEIEFDPQKNWQVTCDCVGILKERNVDVEHRFGDQTGQRCKKKSTRCRMVFRALINNPDGTSETIQVCSQPIVCTQPPGVPEICRKSLVSCPANGGLELFLIGKNFLKDTKVVFQSECNNPQNIWEEHVFPDKEFLQQNHLICGVPPYLLTNINEPVPVRLFVVSGGKASESMKFVYTPVDKNSGPQHASLHQSAQGLINGYYAGSETKEEVKPVLLWESGSSVGMMPPPAAPLRRPSVILPDAHSPPLSDFKSELVDESSQGSLVDSENSDVVSNHVRNNRFKLHNDNSMDINDANSENLHIRVRQLPLENISHDPQMHILPHTETSNLPIVVNDASVDILGLNKTTSNICQMTNNNVDLLINHNDNSKMPIVENNNVTSYTTQLLKTQILPTNSERQPQLMPNACEILNNSRLASPEELKVMDLRMKSNNIDTENDPSLATIRQFVNSHAKLPTQTGQSVETYLSNIDNKPIISQQMDISKPVSMAEFSQQLQTLQAQSTTEVMESVAAAIFQNDSETSTGQSLYSSQSSIQQIVLPQVTPIEQLIATKQLHDTILQDIPYSNNIISTTLDNSTRENLSNQAQLTHQTIQMEALVSSAFHSDIIASSPTTKIESIINSSPESHLSPQHSESSPPRRSPSSHDIILSAHSSPDIVLNTVTSQDMIHTHQPNVLSPDIILNPQVSPTMMCPTDGVLLGSQQLTSTISQQLLPQNTPNGLTIITNNQSNQAENIPLMMSPTVKTPPSTVKNMILNAAAEFFTSDKAIDALVTTAIETANILTNESVQNQSPIICAQNQTVPDMQQQSEQQTLNGSSNQFPFSSTQIPQEQYTPQVIVNEAVGNLVSQMKDNNEACVMNQAVTQVVSQAVSQVFSQAVSQAVNQEMKTSNRTSIAANEILTSMTDNELLNYINPSCFDQV